MSTSNKDELKTKKKKKKTLWNTMEDDIMKNKSKKKRYLMIEQAMKEAGM